MGTDLLRKKMMPIPAGLILLSLLFSSCVATQQDILVLNRQIQTLSSQIYKLEKVREHQAESAAELDSIREALQRLSGTVEENRHLVKHAVERDTLEQDNLKASLADLEAKVNGLYRHLNLEPHMDVQGAAAEQSAIKTGPETSQGVAQGDDWASPEKKRYEETLATYREQKYNDAIVEFENFIKNYPASNLADNAQFWVGESYMALKKYDQAIQSYQKVIEKYPTGNKVPNAMLKQALAFIEAKDPVAAKIVLKKLIKKYPDSDETKIAEATLKTI